MKYLLLILITLLFSVSQCAIAQESAINVQGHVFEKDIKQPIAGAIVTVLGQPSISTTTDQDGQFILTLPNAGRFTLTATASGFDTTSPLVIDLSDNVEAPKPIMYLIPAATLGAVVVTSERSPDKISKNILTGDELRQAPGTMGDPLRAVQSLPGVAMGSDFRSAPAVRGSGPADNAYYVDSLPIGQLFHTDGSSIFHASLINDFNLYSAAFGPQYADVIGGILDVSLRDPRSDKLGGKVGASLLGANALLEGPVADDQSFYIAARRSYFDLLIGKVSSKGVTIQLPSYSDYQGKYLWKLNSDHRLSLYMNGAKDGVSFTVSSTSDIALSQPVLAGDSDIKTSYATQALVLDSVLSDSAYNKLALGRTESELQTQIGSAGSVNADIKTSFLREQYNFQPISDHDVMLSGNYQSVTVGVNIDTLQTTCTQFNPNCDLSSAPRVAVNENIPFQPWDISARDRWLILPQLTLIGGVRQSHDTYLDQTYTEPRLGMEWAWSRNARYSTRAGAGTTNSRRQNKSCAITATPTSAIFVPCIVCWG